MSNATTSPIYELGSDFYDEVRPAQFPSAILRYRNQIEAEKIGLGNLSPHDWQEHFWSFHSLPQNISSPLCLRYHGHQFQHYNPQLGDGRGFLFAQFQVGSRLLDLGTKGSGQTPYSRLGDGRLTLKGAFREILATELLQSYGVNTSKTFSVFETGESLIRNDEPSPTRSAVLVRLSHSHIRFGTFQRLAYLKEVENIKKLVSYCVKYFYPELSALKETELATAFLKSVAQQSVKTLAQWMIAGFVHGVLNTDNMNITGESFDYGPYRFLPEYDPSFTAAYFDTEKLYCFGRQPSAVLWNLHQLGVALRFAYPGLDIEKALENYGDTFNEEIQKFLLLRLNLHNPRHSEAEIMSLNKELMQYLFSFMEDKKALFEQTLYDLHSGASDLILIERLKRSAQKDLYQGASFEKLQKTLSTFEVADQEKAQHQYFSSGKACSLIIEELEALWKPIATSDDWRPFMQKLQEIRSFRGLYD